MTHDRNDYITNTCRQLCQHNLTRNSLWSGSRTKAQVALVQCIWYVPLYLQYDTLVQYGAALPYRKQNSARSTGTDTWRIALACITTHLVKTARDCVTLDAKGWYSPRVHHIRGGDYQTDGSVDRQHHTVVHLQPVANHNKGMQLLACSNVKQAKEL